MMRLRWYPVQSYHMAIDVKDIEKVYEMINQGRIKYDQ